MKNLLNLIFILASSILFGQDFNFWITFTDKSNSPHSIISPETFLSERAIQRRLNQGIEITEQDIPVDPSYLQYLIDNYNVTIRHTSKWFNSVSINTTDSSLIDSITTLPFVSGGQHVNKLFVDFGVENEKNFQKISQRKLSLQGERTFDYGISFDQVNQIGGVDMHELGLQGQGIQIAVLDAGYPGVDVLEVFDSLRANGQIIDTWDFVNGSSYVFHENSHGTMVLSTMGGFLPGELIGTAPKASYHLYITEDVSQEAWVEEDNWIAGVERADSVGADICNTSLGYTTMDDPNQSHEYADLDGNTLRISIAADIAASKGMLMVNSAGNSGDSPWYYIGAPADGDSVLAVGAVNTNGDLASFSSRGPSSDGDIKPNVCGVGWGTVVCSSQGDVFQGNGTSFSGPIIAGMSACLWQGKPGATSMEIKEAIEESSHMYNNPDNNYGYGIPNYLLAFTTITGSTIPDNPEGFEIIGPNPFNEYLIFSLTTESYRGFVEIQVVNAAGQVLLSQDQYVDDKVRYEFSLNVEGDLAPGIYFLRVIGEDFSDVRRMVKW